jgi:hypothetical protein
MRRRLVLVIATAVGVAACGGSSGDSDSASTGATSAAATTATTTPAPACRKGGRALVAAIERSLIDRARIKRVTLLAVKDPPKPPTAAFGRGVYAVAAGFRGKGIQAGTVGFWAVTPGMVKTGRGRAIAADSVTREFSGLGAEVPLNSPASNYASAIAAAETGRAVRHCAEGA